VVPTNDPIPVNVKQCYADVVIGQGRPRANCVAIALKLEGVEAIRGQQRACRRLSTLAMSVLYFDQTVLRRTPKVPRGFDRRSSQGARSGE
jgi:hypothetical protein